MPSSDSGSRPLSGQHPTLAKSFGYSEDSRWNTMALLRECNASNAGDASEATSMSNASLSPSVLDLVNRELERLPERPVFDFLIQYFISDLNWMKQIVHVQSFLTQYEHWWTRGSNSNVRDIEFAVLMLRMVSYSTLFLPSPSHAVDVIRGVSLREICETCSNAASSLAEICLGLDWKGSLARVQHILFAALKCSCEGRTDKFWENIHDASRSAQKAGLHITSSGIRSGSIHQLERDRTLCSLYALDSHLARQLDRIPCLPDDAVADTMVRMRLVQDSDEPGVFTERMLQVQLGIFWRTIGPNKRKDYDPVECEQNYEKFASEFCASLPAAFALQPDTRWDKGQPKLALQRQLLHIAIFDSICWSFRPLLVLKSSYVGSLPVYKRVLLQTQQKRLALSALLELDAVTALHSLVGGSYTRFSAIIFNTFEAAVLLLCLCFNTEFPYDQVEDTCDILHVKVGKLTRRKCMHAAEQALRRLQMLADVSDMAASGSQVLTGLFIKASRSNTETVTSDLDTAEELIPFQAGQESRDQSVFTDLGSWMLPDWTGNPGCAEILFSMMHENTCPDFEIASTSSSNLLNRQSLQ